MNEPPLLITGPGDVVALMPHLLGARPDGSAVIFPVDRGRLQRPVARVDIPQSPHKHRQMAQALATSFERFTGGHVMVLAFTDQLQRATSVCDAVTAALEPATAVVDQIAVQGDWWLRLGDPRPETINQGTITQPDRDRVAVVYIVGRGDPQPYDSIDRLRASFGPAGEDLREAVAPAADRIQAVGGSAPAVAVEQRWMTHAIKGFVASARPLAAHDAARLIGDVNDVSLRDHAVGLMTHEEAGAHAALWKDLLTRSPEQSRTPVANLAAFGAWLHGDGMSARFALATATEQDRMTRLIEALVEGGLDPARWTPPEATEPTETPPGRHDVSGRHEQRRELPPPGGHERNAPPR